MDDHINVAYQQPRIADFGGLGELTASTHLLYGHSGAVEHDLSFSSGSGSPTSSGGALGFNATGSGPGSDTAATGAAAHGAGAGAGAGAGGAGGHHGSLPFTGFPVAVAAATGSALAAGGAALRRWAGRSRDT